LRYEGGAQVTIRDANHRRIGEVAVDATAFRIAPGRHTVTLGGRLDPADEAKARLEIRPRGSAEPVALP
jgi:hypothetical protein